MGCLQLQLQREALSPEEVQSVQEHLGYHSDSLRSVRVTGKKPNFEVGSSSQLKLPNKKSSSGKTSWGYSSVCGRGGWRGGLPESFLQLMKSLRPWEDGWVCPQETSQR